MGNFRLKVPKISVMFKDGRSEESLLVLPFNDAFFVVTKEGNAFHVSKDEILVYHPERITQYISVSGRSSIDYSDCFLPDDSIDRVILDYKDSGD